MQRAASDHRHRRIQQEYKRLLQERLIALKLDRRNQESMCMQRALPVHQHRKILLVSMPQDCSMMREMDSRYPQHLYKELAERCLQYSTREKREEQNTRKIYSERNHTKRRREKRGEERTGQDRTGQDRGGEEREEERSGRGKERKSKRAGKGAC